MVAGRTTLPSRLLILLSPRIDQYCESQSLDFRACDGSVIMEAGTNSTFFIPLFSMLTVDGLATDLP